MNYFADKLKHVFKVLNRKILVALLFLMLILISFDFLAKIGIITLFVAVAGLSKIYHRFFKSSLGIDLVFFTTIIISLSYNPILGLLTGWLGLICADAIGAKFSYTSIVSLIGITIVALFSAILRDVNTIIAGLILLILFELVVTVLYFLLGSSKQKMLIFLISHFFTNLFLIVNFAVKLKQFLS